ncbi:unnamed protein product [Spodoptera littoralis]|uniref:Uncharacterized protein n=1 Tax=Spodoptera littoralis TaxID=7109 RepID=A0A9P0IL41_SPOLI|nr:unnamed protein product [Spodoptera littoralis]CAH1647749.1 unnamed protein product [Spodoptera littoralis]
MTYLRIEVAYKSNLLTYLQYECGSIILTNSASACTLPIQFIYITVYILRHT